MKKRIVLFAVMILAIPAVACGAKSDTSQEPLSAVVESAEALAAEASAELSDTTRSYNALFDNPPDTEARDEERPFEPTDIFQMYCFDYENGCPLESTTRAHVTVLYPAFLSYEWDNSTELKNDFNNISLFSEYGLESIGWKSTHAFEGGIVPDGFDSESTYCRDIDGNPTCGDLESGGCDDPMYCISNPEYEEYIINCHLEAVVCGSSCTASDAWAATSVCFCDYCMEGFREYLKETMTDRQLLLLGIEDIDTFDYGDYIRENYYDLYQENYSSGGISSCIPLAEEYNTFQYLEITALQKRIQQAVEDANEVYGADVLVGANMADLNVNFMACADTVDFFSPELNLPYDPYPREAVRYELANAFGTVLTGHPNAVQAADLMLSSACTQTHKILTAEAYAHGGFLQIPDQSPYRSSSDMNIYEAVDMSAADMEELYPYYDFIYYNGLFFEQLWPTADVAVLYSFPSNLNSNLSDTSFWGISQSLITRNIPFRVIATGDGTMIEKSLTEDDLSGLKVVILPRVDYLSEADRALLKQFIEDGGTVLSVGLTAVYDETGEPLTDDFTAMDFSSSSLDGYKHIYGHYEWSEEGFQDSYWIEPDEIETIITAVEDEIVLPYMIDDADIVVTQYFSTYFSGYLYHLVNYAFDQESEQITEKNDVLIRLLNDTPYDPDDIALYYSTPESGETVVIDFVENDGYLEAYIPNIVAWGTIMLGQKADIEQAMQENSEKCSTKTEERAETLTTYTEAVQSTTEEIGLFAYTVQDEETSEPAERENEAPTDTDYLIYELSQQGGMRLFALMPDEFAALFTSVPDYVSLSASARDGVWFHIPYDDEKSAQEIVGAVESQLGITFEDNGWKSVAQKDDITMEISPQDNGEVHLMITVGGESGEQICSLFSGIYESFSLVRNLPELYALSDPAYVVTCNDGTMSFSISWSDIGDGDYQAAKDYYNNVLVSSYVTFITQEGDSTAYVSHTPESSQSVKFVFTDAGNAIEISFNFENDTDQ